MPIAASDFPFDFDPEMLRIAREAARQMEAIGAMGGLTAFTRVHEHLREAAEAMRLQQKHIASIALSPTILRIAEDHRRMIEQIREHAAPLRRMMEDLDRSLMPFHRSVLELAQSAALNAFQAISARGWLPPDYLMASLAEPIDVWVANY